MKKLYIKRYCPIISLLIIFLCGSAYALQGSTAANGSNAQAVHSCGITGLGINVGLITAKNVQANHLAFLEPNGQTRVFNYDFTETSLAYDYHDTPFAGIIKSRGSISHPNDIGVSPDCVIHCGKVCVDNSIDDAHLENALNSLIVTYGCKVIVTGIQLPPDVDPVWSRMYDYYAEKYDVVFANAAGNQNTEFSNISVFGDGYNGITTGGLEEPVMDNYSRVGNITCLGPTIDGRRKPDVMAPANSQVAPGYSSSSNNYWHTTSITGATSWAVPHTGGVAALLLQYANQTADADDGHNAVIKAVIVNSTFPNIDDEDGIPTNPADPNNTWHNERGYGRIDALRAYQTLSGGRVNKGTTLIMSSAGWAYDSMYPNATHTYMLFGKENERLVLTITWHRKVTKTGSNYSDESFPKFNIDLTVKHPSDVNIYEEKDALNNLVKIDLPLKSTGEYEIILTNKTNKSRDYAIAFERYSYPGDFNFDYIVDGKDLGQLVLEWLSSGTGLETDIFGDGNVNNRDFGEFAENWMRIDQRYYNP